MEPSSASSSSPYLSKAALAASSKAAKKEDRRKPDDDERSNDSSDLSSAPSMGRQMTEVSNVECMDVLERQCSGFQNRSSDFWLRQNTTPAKSQAAETMAGLRRQLSAPMPASNSAPMKPLRPLLSSIEDVDGASNSTGMASRQASQRVEEDMDTQEGLGLIEVAICMVVSECDFSVCVSDPNSLDSELIAVSDGFTRLTGYEREEAIGENCRFLNKECKMPPEQRKPLFEAVESGASFTGVVKNRKKSGELFQNLLDVRGLVIAKHARTGEDIWITLAVQSDVTGMSEDEMPENHSKILSQVASRIRKRLQKQLAELGLSGCMVPASFAGGGAGAGGSSSNMQPKDSWYLLSEISWRAGDNKALSSRTKDKSVAVKAEKGVSDRGIDTEHVGKSVTIVTEATEPDEVALQRQGLPPWLSMGVIPIVGALLLVSFVRISRKAS